MSIFGGSLVQLSAAGTELPVFLLDGTVFTVLVKSDANIGDVCVAIRTKVSPGGYQHSRDSVPTASKNSIVFD